MLFSEENLVINRNTDCPSAERSNRPSQVPARAGLCTDARHAGTRRVTPGCLCAGGPDISK